MQCWKSVVQHCEDVNTVQVLLVMMIGAPCHKDVAGNLVGDNA